MGFFWLTFVYPFYAFRLWRRDLQIAMQHPTLLAIALYYRFYYFFFYPVFRQAYQKFKAGVSVHELVYGETPLHTFEDILTHIKLHHSDHFVDLGCGRGMLTFYVNLAYGIPCTGVDIIPTFITKANQMVKKHRLEDVDFVQAQIMDFPLEMASVVYITATCFSPETLKKLKNKLFSELRSGSTVISITHPIVDEGFSHIWDGTLPFYWGHCEVYVFRKL